MLDKFIPIYQPRIAKNQKKYVLECETTNWISSRGKYVDQFEETLAEYLGVKHVVSCSNGSVSLMLILKALGIGPGDEVITQSLTYAATVSSILNVGATPVLVDSNEAFQLDIPKMMLEESSIVTGHTKAVIVAQLYGDAPDSARLLEFCNKHGLVLIEDSAECFGCSVGGVKVGAHGHASSFSFYGNKIITCGEGGCVATDSDVLAEELRLLRGQAHVGDFWHRGPGYNFRLTNPQAARGLAQLEEVDDVIKRKKRIAELYRNNLPKQIDSVVPFIDSSEWMPLFLLPEGVDYLTVKGKLRVLNVDTRPCFPPVHLMEEFSVKTPVSLSVAERIYKRGFNLPCYPDLTDEQILQICKCVSEVIDQMV
jgi:perosamine synthetase